MELGAGTVEHDGLNALGLGRLGCHLSHQLGAGLAHAGRGAGDDRGSAGEAHQLRPVVHLVLL